MACCMLGSGGVPLAAVSGVETPRPLHGARSEYEGAARTPVERQVVRIGAGARVAAVVDECLDIADGGGRQVEEPGRPEAVVGVLIPFVAECPAPGSRV